MANDNEESLRYDVRITATKELIARCAIYSHAVLVADRHAFDVDEPTCVIDLHTANNLIAYSSP